MPNDADAALMAAMADGNTVALAKLYDRHAGLVFSLCLRVLRDRSAAEETLLDVFHELYRKADRYDPLRGSVLTFLATLARNRAIDRQRTRKHVGMDVGLDEALLAQLTPTETTEDPLYQASMAEQRLLVRQAIKRLDASHRQVIELSYFDGLSHSQIAQQTARPLGTVKSHLRMAITRLRELMDGRDLSRSAK